MRNILVIYYSQTGQIKEISTNFLKPMSLDFSVDFVEIKNNDFLLIDNTISEYEYHFTLF